MDNFLKKVSIINDYNMLTVSKYGVSLQNIRS